MKCQISAILLLVNITIQSVLCQEKPKEYKVGQPQFKLDATGGGTPRNYGVGFNAGVGTKVWESKKKDMSVELGATYGQNFGRVDGHSFQSKPQYGLGGTFRWGKKR